MSWKDMAEQALRDAERQREDDARRREAGRKPVYDAIDTVARQQLRAWCERVGMSYPDSDRQDTFAGYSDPDGYHEAFKVCYRWSDAGYCFEARAWQGDRGDVDVNFYLEHEPDKWGSVDTREQLGQALRWMHEKKRDPSATENVAHRSKVMRDCPAAHDSESRRAFARQRAWEHADAAEDANARGYSVGELGYYHAQLQALLALWWQREADR